VCNLLIMNVLGKGNVIISVIIDSCMYVFVLESGFQIHDYNPYS